MRASTKNGSRRASLILGGAAAIGLSFTAAAWACTADMHNLNVQTSSLTRTGQAGTAVSATGICYSTACPKGTSVQLRQDGTPSTGRKNVVDHNATCRAEGLLADEPIGTVDLDGSGVVSGSGIIASRPAPGPYVVCAGNTDAVTSLLWDVFTLS